MKQLIERNAAELVRLQARTRETLAVRSQSPAMREEWAQACEEFNAKFDRLAFPGGYTGALERLKAGDPNTMEAAICFLEVRPYFIRSGYMFHELLRKAKRAPLTDDQRARLEVIVAKVEAWKARKRALPGT